MLRLEKAADPASSVPKNVGTIITKAAKVMKKLGYTESAVLDFTSAPRMPRPESVNLAAVCAHGMRQPALKICWAQHESLQANEQRVQHCQLNTARRHGHTIAAAALTPPLANAPRQPLP